MMKKIVASACLLLAGIIIIPEKSTAQVRVGVNINISDQPLWRDPGYDYVEYYYLPDVESYYYVPRHEFVYLSNGRWIFSASLPPKYRNYDLYSGYKVVVNRPNAYRYYEQNRVRYTGRNNFRNERHDRYERHDNGRHNGWNKHRHH